MAESSDPDKTGEERRDSRPKPPVEHQFKPGNPGRPKGSRNKLGEAFLAELHKDFQAHGSDAITKVRDQKPDAYLKVIASILPKELKVSVDEFDELSDDELDRRIRHLARALSLEVGVGEGAGGEGTPQTLQ